MSEPRFKNASGPRRNRVTPAGAFEAVEARGTFMGNRGRLHDCTGTLGTATYQHRGWITCELEWKGKHRQINAPGSYTELFFADEATALAAGHRPCAMCRRPAFDVFRSAWQAAHGLARPPRAAEIDANLHAARIDTAGRQRTRVAQLGTLPDGVMVERPGFPGRAALIWAGQLHPWRHTGYASPIAADMESQVVVLTPRPTVAVLRAGYRPVAAVELSQAGVSTRQAARPLADAHGRP